VLSTTLSYLTIYRDPVVANNVSRSDFRIRDLMHSEEPVTLYIVTEPVDKQRLQPLVRVLVNMIVRLSATGLSFGSDIHFDPLADISILEDLTKDPADQWEGTFAKSRQNEYARAPADTNYPLLKSALCAAKAQGPYDFLIASGDYLRHNFQERFPAVSKHTSDPAAFATKTEVFVINALQKAFGVPVYLALGNNDSNTGDYDIDPESAFLVTLGHAIGVLAKDPEAEADFCTAGYYELPHPDLANEEIIVLNTVLWSRLYGIIGSKVVEPGWAEMDWFAEKLNQAETRGHKVILVMHMPPGLDSYSCSRQKSGKAPIELWEDAFLTKFCDLTREYGGIIQIALAGHTHTDDFRVLGKKRVARRQSSFGLRRQSARYI
jgi:sphingomyelin phosphodiesterase acid-like 3